MEIAHLHGTANMPGQWGSRSRGLLHELAGRGRHEWSGFPRAITTIQVNVHFGRTYKTSDFAADEPKKAGQYQRALPRPMVDVMAAEHRMIDPEGDPAETMLGESANIEDWTIVLEDGIHLDESEHHLELIPKIPWKRRLINFWNKCRRLIHHPEIFCRQIPGAKAEKW